MVVSSVVQAKIDIGDGRLCCGGVDAAVYQVEESAPSFTCCAVLYVDRNVLSGPTRDKVGVPPSVCPGHGCSSLIRISSSVRHPRKTCTGDRIKVRILVGFRQHCGILNKLPEPAAWCRDQGQQTRLVQVTIIQFIVDVAIGSVRL